jgi:CHAT domain-containing protein
VKKIAVLQKRHSITDVEMVESLKKEELYIDFAKIAEYYFVFTLSAEGFLDMHLIGAKITTQIESEIHAFRKEMIDTGKTTQKRAKRLYRLLLADILEKKPFRDKSTLIISPDGLLNLFPFEALYDTKREGYLIETKKIRYVPNGKALVSFREDQHKGKQQKMAIFANPDYNMQHSESNSSSVHKNISNKETFSYLPGTMEEVMLILKSMKPQQTQVYLGREATEKNLFALKSPKILHISTHGYFLESDEPNPMLKSALALSGANHALISRDSEGIVTALKLSGLDLEETELVVLSACETGVTDEDATESISGLSQAFIEAGSQSVIVTLWPVSVKGSNLFMEFFYRKVAEGISYTAALQAVKKRMIKMELPVSVWAPFVINGS